MCEFGDGGLSEEMKHLELTKLDACVKLKDRGWRRLWDRFKKFVYWIILFRCVKLRKLQTRLNKKGLQGAMASCRPSVKAWPRDLMGLQSMPSSTLGIRV